MTGLTPCPLVTLFPSSEGTSAEFSCVFPGTAAVPHTVTDVLLPLKTVQTLASVLVVVLFDKVYFADYPVSVCEELLCSGDRCPVSHCPDVP